MVTGVKLSQIASGGPYDLATDVLVGVRSGATDLLLDLSNFLSYTGANRTIDLNGQLLVNVGQLLVGSTTDDGSGLFLQAPSASFGAGAVEINGGGILTTTMGASFASGAFTLDNSGNVIASGVINFLNAVNFSTSTSGILTSQLTNDAGFITAASAPVQTVSNSDTTLQISPTTGAVVASLNLGATNTWLNTTTFRQAPVVHHGSPSSYALRQDAFIMGRVDFPAYQNKISYSTSSTLGSTGIYFELINAGATGYITALTLLGTGGVGMGGVTVPLSACDIGGGLAVGAYAGVTAAPTNGFIVSGLVGINTSSPDQLLTILSPNSYDGTYAKFAATAGASSYNLILNGVNNGSGMVYYSFDTTNGGTTFANNLVLFGGLVGIMTNAPTAFLDTPASTTAAASLRIRAGVAPTSPNDGEIYNESSTHHLKVRLNGVTYQLDQQVIAGSVPLIVGNDRKTGLTAAQALATYTVGGSDTTFMVSANINITAVTVASFQTTCTYTDETNTSRTLILNFSQISGTLVQTLTAALGAGAYEGVPLQIRAKAGTTIIISSAAGGTYTSITYNLEERIMQL